MQAMEGLRMMVEEACVDFNQWRLRLEAAEEDKGGDPEVLCFCADRLEDAREWWQACGWVCEEAWAEWRAGKLGRFSAVGRALVEEAREGAHTEELLEFVWMTVGVPEWPKQEPHGQQEPHRQLGEEQQAGPQQPGQQGQPAKERQERLERSKRPEQQGQPMDGQQGRRERSQQPAQQGQRGQQKQQGQPMAGQQERLERSQQPEQQRQREQQKQQVQPVVEEFEAGALESLSQTLRWEGTLHPTWRSGADGAHGCMSLVQEVDEGDLRVSRLSTWMERKRLFDPGG